MAVPIRLIGNLITYQVYQIRGGLAMIKGIVRNVDPLGRITLPKEMRRTAGIGAGDPVDIYFRDGVISIEPCRLQCVCCGNTKVSLKEVNGVHMCRKCINEFKEV